MAEDWSLHVARLTCNIFTLTFLKILCENVEVNQVEKQMPALLCGRGCSSAWLHLLPVICFLSCGFYTFPCQYFSPSTLELISPSQECQFCVFTFLIFYGFFSSLIFSYLKKQFSQQNWAKVTELCCIKPSLGSHRVEPPHQGLQT